MDRNRNEYDLDTLFNGSSWITKKIRYGKPSPSHSSLIQVSVFLATVPSVPMHARWNTKESAVDRGSKKVTVLCSFALAARSGNSESVSYVPYLISYDSNSGPKSLTKSHKSLLAIGADWCRKKKRESLIWANKTLTNVFIGTRESWVHTMSYLLRWCFS